MQYSLGSSHNAPASTLALIIASVLYIYSIQLLAFFLAWLATAVFLYYPSPLLPFFFFLGFEFKFSSGQRVISDVKQQLFGFLSLFKGLGSTFFSSTVCLLASSVYCFLFARTVSNSSGFLAFSSMLTIWTDQSIESAIILHEFT